MSRKLYIIGDSHTNAVKSAVNGSLSEEYSEKVQVKRFSKEKNGKIIGDHNLAEFKQIIASLSDEWIVVSFTGGNQHNSIGLIQHPKAFTLDELASENDIKIQDIVPKSLLLETLERGLRGNDFKRLIDIADVSPVKVVHVAAPPPKEDSEHILAKHETSFANNDIVSKGVTDAALRLAIYETQMDATSKICAENGIMFIPFPEEAKCPKGFLARQYYAEDATHANEDFGRLIIDRLLDLEL